MKLLIIIISLFISACNNNLRNLMIGIPYQSNSGNPYFAKGWKDGCSTGKTIYSNDMMRSMYSIEMDAQLIKNKTYRKAWTTGRKYCMYYVSSYLRGGYVDQTVNGYGFAQDLRDDNTWFGRNDGDGWGIFRTFSAR